MTGENKTSDGLSKADAGSSRRMDAALRLHQEGRLDEASKIYLGMLAENPDSPEALHFLGLCHHQAGDNARALPLMARSIELSPGDASFYLNFAPVLLEEGRLDDAEACCRKALSMQPDNPRVLNNLGNVHEARGNFGRAVSFYSRAVSLDPSFADAHDNIGVCRQKLGELDEAVAAYRKALSICPLSAQARWNLSQALLLKGDFAGGWREFEARLDKPEFAYLRGGRPRPSGDFGGASVLVVAEQGFGDTVQFIRFLPLLKSRAGRVVLRCQAPLLRLLEGFPGVDLSLPSDTPLDAIESDFQIPLLSLPFFLGIVSPDAFRPLDFPYLRPPPAALEKWAGIVPAGRSFNVGLVWAGSPGHKNDKARSMRAEDFAPLLDIPGASFHSVQVGLAAAGVAALPGVTDFSGGISDFSDTAGLLSRLDLLVAVDTSVAHLAGAMGVDTFLLLPFAPDWRWLSGGSESAWYPSLRIFRQRVPGDWSAPLKDVFEEVGRIAERDA